MKEIITADLPKNTPKTVELEEDPFGVIYNHRAAALKKRRKLLRKLNAEKKKRQHGQAVRDFDEENERLNRNMFNEDDIWEVLVDGTLDFKRDQESNTTEISTVSSVEMALRYVSQLPEMPKKSIFSETFPEFRFECQI